MLFVMFGGTLCKWEGGVAPGSATNVVRQDRHAWLFAYIWLCWYMRRRWPIGRASALKIPASSPLYSKSQQVADPSIMP